MAWSSSLLRFTTDLSFLTPWSPRNFSHWFPVSALGGHARRMHPASKTSVHARRKRVYHSCLSIFFFLPIFRRLGPCLFCAWANEARQGGIRQCPPFPHTPINSSFASFIPHHPWSQTDNTRNATRVPFFSLFFFFVLSSCVPVQLFPGEKIFLFRPRECEE